MEEKEGLDQKSGRRAYRFKGWSVRNRWYETDDRNVAGVEVSYSTGTVKPIEINPNSWYGRNWKWASPALTILFFAAIFFGGGMLVKSSDVYKESFAALKHDPRATAILGTEISEPYFFSSNQSDTYARMKISVSGNKGKGDLYVEAINTTGHWRYRSLVLHTENEDVDLLTRE